MSEVYARPLDVLGYGPGRRNGQQWLTTIVKDDTVTVKQSIARAGETKTGKNWMRFDPFVTTFWSIRSGRLRVYERNKFGIQDRTAFKLEAGSLPLDSPEAMAALARWYPAMDFPDDSPVHRWEWMGKTTSAQRRDMTKIIREAAYPLAEAFNLQPGLTSSLSGTAQSLVVRQFGQSRYRKDLVKAVSSLGEIDRGNATQILTMCIAAAPTVPVDWIITALRNRAYEGRSRGGYYGLGDNNGSIAERRKLFRALNQKSLRRLFLNDNILAHAYQFNDTLKSFELFQKHEVPIDTFNFTSWADLHDVLAREARKLKNKPRPIVYQGAAQSLVGTWALEGQQIEIQAPETTHTVIDWGAQMNHCIGSYANQAPDRSLLYAIYVDGRLVGNMESDPKRGDIRQLLGKHNRHLHQPVVDTVKHAVKTVWPEANTDRGWGVQVRDVRGRQALVAPAEDDLDDLLEEF